MPLTINREIFERFSLAKGQSDLVRRKDGKWFLLVSADVPDKTPAHVTEFIGVDLGVVNIAADSDGEVYTSDKVEDVRQRYRRTRHSLQKKAAKHKRSGKRAKKVRRELRDLSGRERRFKADTNHCISKKIVEKATDTNRGIALEELQGIRDKHGSGRPSETRCRNGRLPSSGDSLNTRRSW